MALEAANQALAAANAAVQAAVRALAMSTTRHDEELSRSRGGGSIRKAASQARKSAGGEASGDAPLTHPKARKAATAPRSAAKAAPAARAAAPKAAEPRPAEPRSATPRDATPKPAASKAAPSRPAAAPSTAVVPAVHAPTAPPPSKAPPADTSFAARKRGAAPEHEEHGESPTRARIRKSLESDEQQLPPRPLPTESAPKVPEAPAADNGARAPRRQEPEAARRPPGAGPIHLGPSTAPVPPPTAAAPGVVETPAHQVDQAEIARHESELREREAEIAAREAAMARYAPVEPGRTVPARPQAEANGYTVLVVDDEEQVRALTVRILTRFGYRVLEASGVEIALSLLDEPTANVDLVLSDVAMPGLSGKDLFRAISQSRPGLPVVFMSGYALGVYAPEGLIEEGVKMLPKPFTQEDLLGFVTEALEGAAAR